MKNRTIKLVLQGIVYDIKIIGSSLTVWRNGTALTGKSVNSEISKDEALIVAVKMIDEYYDSIWNLEDVFELEGRIGNGLCV